MNRTITIIAVASIGLNIGLGAAIGLGLWSNNQALAAAPTPFSGAADSQDSTQSETSPGTGRVNLANERSPQLPLECRRALQQAQAIPQSCGPLAQEIAALPTGEDGAPIIPRRENGTVNWQELGRLLGRDGPPPRPRSVKELEESLALTNSQSRAFRQVMRDRRQARKVLSSRLVATRGELQTAVEATDFDLDAAMALYQRTLDVRIEALSDQARRYLEFFDDLSQDQRAIVLTWSNGNILKLLE